MSRLTGKFVAVLMLLWLPIFTGSALAASVSMQLQRGTCHEAAASTAISHADSEHHQHHSEAPTVADQQDTSCSACGICHLACTGYLVAPSAGTTAEQAASLEITPFLVVFSSFTSAPLVPPPLARA
ncbi:DUF2946 domain-containing protein [Ferrigenium sp. UT5]|uniref:DUF2946 domain-containing protein n=1 Tax=Ferrigenium sp. UT5 TaxID=3242105 RepID=UPI0038B3EA24